MQDNNIINLFGFKDVVFDSFNEDNEFVYIHACVSKMSICPKCGSKKIWFTIIGFKRLEILISVVKNL